MKDLLPTAFLIVLGACSASAKQESTDPTPSGSATPAGATTATGEPSTPPTRCPALQIKAPDVVAAGQAGQVTLNATDAGGTPTLTWAVDGGTLESGQGTPSISVRSTAAAGKPVTVTVTLGNLPAECETKTASATFLVGA